MNMEDKVSGVKLASAWTAVGLTSTADAGGQVAASPSWWAAIGISSWSELAALLAAVYTLALLVDLAWRRLFSKRRDRRAEDQKED